MKTNLYSNVFSKGQLCEWMAGRFDTDSYSKGAKSLLNCLVRPFGGAYKRPGSLYIGETKTTDTTRLIPFSFSVAETYVIEVGAGYFRFYKDGALILDGGSPYEVSNTYIESDITDLRFTQSNDVLFLTVGSVQPKKLKRITDTDWDFEDLGYVDGPFLLENSSATTINPSATTGAITLTASTGIFTADHVGSYWSINVKKTVDDVLVQGVVRITGFTSSTVVNATVTKELFNANATTIWAEGAWSFERGFPKAIAFSDSRLWLANTETETQKVWGSEVFVYNNFDKEESVEIELPSNKLNSINSLVNARDLFAFTLGGAFIINSGSNREAITGENISSYQQGNTGALNIQAEKIGDFVYYPQRSGEKLIEFKYSWEVEGYISDEISMVNEDILESGIKDMALQENEDNVLYSVLNNGKIAALTRVTSQEVSALSPLETDGDFISVASISNENQFWDDVYLIVQRTIDGTLKQYVELFQKPRKTELTTGVFCDSAYVYSGARTTELDIVGTTATSTGAFLLTDVGNIIRIADDSEFGYAFIEITAYIDADNVTVDYSGANINTSDWYMSIQDIDVLSHLEGKSVQILRDGSVEPVITVSGGSIELEKPGFDVIVGLGYLAEVEPMPFSVTSKKSGASGGNLTRPVYSTLRVIDTMGIEVEGGNFDEDVFVRKYNLVMGKPNPLFTGTARVGIPKGFDLDSTIKIKQENPLPMNILSITTKTQLQET